MPASRLVVCASDGGGLDAVDRGGLGVLGDQVSRDAEFLGDSLPIHGRTVGLGVSSNIRSTNQDLLAGQAGSVLEFVLDGIGLLGQLCDLGVKSAECVDLDALLNCVEELNLCGGQGCIHFAVFH